MLLLAGRAKEQAKPDAARSPSRRRAARRPRAVDGARNRRRRPRAGLLFWRSQEGWLKTCMVGLGGLSIASQTYRYCHNGETPVRGSIERKMWMDDGGWSCCAAQTAFARGGARSASVHACAPTAPRRTGLTGACPLGRLGYAPVTTVSRDNRIFEKCITNEGGHTAVRRSCSPP